MLRYSLAPIIFLLNNHGYSIESVRSRYIILAFQGTYFGFFRFLGSGTIARSA